MNLNPDCPVTRLNDDRERAPLARRRMDDGVCGYLAGQEDHVIGDRAAVNGLGDELPHVPHFLMGAAEHARARNGYPRAAHSVAARPVPWHARQVARRREAVERSAVTPAFAGERRRRTSFHPLPRHARQEFGAVVVVSVMTCIIPAVKSRDSPVTVPFSACASRFRRTNVSRAG
jgi:hypothetical protein